MATLTRPSISATYGVTVGRQRRFTWNVGVLLLAWARTRAGSARATRALTATAIVTARAFAPYALTVGSLACLTISAFTVSVTLGFAAAGLLGLWFNWGMQRDRG